MKLSELQVVMDALIADARVDIQKACEVIAAAETIIRNTSGDPADNPAVQHLADQVMEVHDELGGALRTAVAKLADVLPHPADPPPPAPGPDTPVG